MKQNYLYLIIGALVVAVIALGIYVYREETKPKAWNFVSTIPASQFRKNRSRIRVARLAR
ncbi:hypothetical protein [Mesorhizobium sp. M0895]|uniref:hypothetical protein n=1 Tax=Mesorhizobium sp. M0895 TaxID=2957019 RepID=UPI003336DA83